MDLNIDLKNINIDDLKAKVLAFADKKTLIKGGISFGAIVFFLIIYYSILNPIVNNKKAKLADMTLKQEEVAAMKSEIAGYKKKIKKLTPEYENFSTLFHTRAETEGLYQTLSVYAGENGLVISKIEKKEPTQVSKSEALAAADPFLNRAFLFLLPLLFDLPFTLDLILWTCFNSVKTLFKIASGDFTIKTTHSPISLYLVPGMINSNIGN